MVSFKTIMKNQTLNKYVEEDEEETEKE